MRVDNNVFSYFEYRNERVSEYEQSGTNLVPGETRVDFLKPSGAFFF